MREEIKKIQGLMEGADYVTDPAIATSVHLAMTLRKPLLVEGPAGVGKTEVAKVMARMLGTTLIRLQCYEGLDAAQALYEWNYPKQILHIKLTEQSSRSEAEREHEIFSEPFLLRRPLLQAISQDGAPPVLLIDEVDRCVTADTLIQTTTGVKRAEGIRPGDRVLSFDPGQFRLVEATVARVIPRQARSLVRLLVGGRFLEVTPEHRFVRYADGGHEVVRAADLRAGDRLPLHKGHQPPGIDEPRFEFRDSVVKLSPRGKRFLHRAYKSSGRTYEQLAEAAGLSLGHLRNVIGPGSSRDSLRAGVLEALSAELALNGPMADPRHARGLRIRQSVAFYELLGYMVADGCFTSDRLCIADKGRDLLTIYAQKFEEAFGERARILPGPHANHELTYHGLPLGRFLRRVVGRGITRSRRRVVPDFVFSLPADKRAGFVRGFFDGEGWVGDHQVSVVSAAPYLAVGIQHLLSSLGVDSHLSIVHPGRSGFGRGPCYQLAISDIGAFADAVGFCSPAKRKRLGQRPRRRGFARTETLPKDRVDPLLADLRARTVLHEVPHHQTVHDMLAGRIRPNVSSLRRIAGTFDCPGLDDLLGRGVVLGEITTVERVEAPQAVYDFVLEGQPYFVANQVVTHNCDEEFEAFLLEVLSDFQVTIPEIGTVKATVPPYVILTSNRNRELSDALRRRCLYLWIDFPSFDKEVRIVSRKVPGVNERLAREISRFMESIRTVRLSKVPGVAETLDWAQALCSLHADRLDEELLVETLGCVLKDADDVKRFKRELAAGGLGRFVPAEG